MQVRMSKSVLSKVQGTWAIFYHKISMQFLEIIALPLQGKNCNLVIRSAGKISQNIQSFQFFYNFQKLLSA